MCGGDGSSCLDCNNELNGPAILECGTCFASAAAAAGARDCAGACGAENVLITVAGAEVCVRADAAANFTLCDGSADSDAKINECGVTQQIISVPSITCLLTCKNIIKVCYGGNTNKTATAGMDECGICVVDTAASLRSAAVSCACDESRDDCGSCAVPGSSAWNAACSSGQRKFARLETSVIDKIRSTYSEVRLKHEDFNKKNGKKYNCFLEDTATDKNKFQFVDVEIGNGFIKLGKENPPSGSYKVRCYEEPDMVYETGENDILNIYNSLDVQVRHASDVQRCLAVESAILGDMFMFLGILIVS